MQHAAREHTVRANGLAHHVIEWGPADASEVVLLCHGFLDLGFGFASLAPLLAASGLRVIAFDFRGHGETEWVGKGGYYHFPDYLLDLHELLPQLTSEAVHLVGHSMGGTVSALFAATHPGRLRTLALLEGLGPPAERPELAAERMKTWLADVDAVRKERGPAKLRDLTHALERLRARNPTVDGALLSLLAEKATKPHPDGDGLAWRFDPLHRTRSPLGFDLGRFRQLTPHIHVPTLLLYGSLGLRTGDDEQRAATLPNARTVTIEGASHMMHWTHPAETAHLLLGHFAPAA
jgi:pimeloyl-ACP methyl ester carboxylesterase